MSSVLKSRETHMRAASFPFAECAPQPEYAKVHAFGEPASRSNLVTLEA